MVITLDPCPQCGNYPDYLRIEYRESAYDLLGCQKCRLFNTSIGDFKWITAIQSWNNGRFIYGHQNVTILRVIMYSPNSFPTGLKLFIAMQEAVTRK